MENPIYKGKLAQFYDQLFGNQQQDLEFYKYFLEQKKGTALEIGSGTGRLMLPYLEHKFNVEGIESSSDMIAICKKKASSLGLDPIVHELNLENLHLKKKYDTIYMPLFVFQNIIERDKAIQALQLTYDQLQPNGQILITLYFPWNDPTGTWEQTWRISQVAKDDENSIVLSESVSFDKFEQIETKNFKHEFFKDGLLSTTFFSSIQFRYYSRWEFTLLLQEIGFKKIEIFGDYSLDQANYLSNTFIFHGIK